jgi:uncharacterized LabA/DUF88 family protein
MCFVDGFNLYHALNWYMYGQTEEENRQYRKYKWLSLTALAKCYISPVSQQLVGVKYFTTLSSTNPMKRFRHQLYVWAQECEGVEPAFGTFRDAAAECKATCKETFIVKREKQTDVKIAVTMVEMARLDKYDHALIVSGDADLIPAIEMTKNVHRKEVAVVVPIGRKGEDIERACGKHKFKMLEEHLQRCQMPSKLKHPNGKYVMKPDEYK